MPTSGACPHSFEHVLVFTLMNSCSPVESACAPSLSVYFHFVKLLFACTCSTCLWIPSPSDSRTLSQAECSPGQQGDLPRWDCLTKMLPSFLSIPMTLWGLMDDKTEACIGQLNTSSKLRATNWWSVDLNPQYFQSYVLWRSVLTDFSFPAPHNPFSCFVFLSSNYHHLIYLFVSVFCSSSPSRV